MPVEILTVSLSEDSLERVARLVAQYLRNEDVTLSNPPSPETHRTQSGQNFQQEADPWTGASSADNGTMNPPPGGWQPGPANNGPQIPTCAHGEMKYVPAGFSKNTGRSYAAFYACPAPRGAECKGSNGRSLTAKA